MPKNENEHSYIPPKELLGKLPKMKFEKEQLSQRLQEIPLETRLLSLAGISIEKETENLREILTHTGKHKGFSEA